MIIFSGILRRFRIGFLGIDDAYLPLHLLSEVLEALIDGVDKAVRGSLVGLRGEVVSLGTG